MAFRPFLANISTARTYYGTALSSNQSAQDYWTNSEQQPIVSTQNSVLRTLGFGAVAGGVFAAGFLRTKTGNVWDKYLKGIRAVEEYSPGGVLRTLQTSNFFSSYSSVVRDANLFISPELLSSNKVYRDYLARIIGPTKGLDPFLRLGIEGATFKQGKLFWGQGSEVALKYASALTAVGHGASQRYGAAYARMLDTAGNIPLEHFFAQIKPSENVLNPLLNNMPAQIIGGQTIGQALFRRGSAVGTELVERFNRLLGVPFENKFLHETIGKYLDLGVKKSGGLRMLGSLSAKYGIALGGLALGYQSLDYLMNKSDVFNNTIFDEGLTTGLATGVVKANLFASKTADFFGLHSYREKQEEIAPGSTDIQKLIAFPLIGAFSMSMSAYGLKVSEMYRMQRAARLAGKPLAAAAAREAVEKQMAEWGGKSILARAGKYLTTESGVFSRSGILGKIVRRISKPDKEGNLIFKFFGKMGPVKLAGAIGAGLGLAAVAPFLPGALIPSERPEELEDLYSGRKEVAVRKGRWWSMGRTPYEGDKISYFRPHWFARLRMGARDKSIYGNQELSPLEKWFKREFTYDLEQQHYYDRPYPITALPFEDVPLIGPLLANTIGRLIKPPKLMHTEEWMGSGGATKSDYPRFKERYATEIGQVPGGTPVSPYSASQTVGEQIYRMTEMVGLPGFLESSLKDELTGSQDWFDKYKQLESARRIDGMERWYWDQELGDMFMTNEAFRRLYPHRRRQIDLYNPIRNTMPDWLPGPGDKSPDFLHGDPYTKVQEGELRLPGKGYEARYPELEGTAPEDYPLIHKFKILADVAPYADKFGEILGEVRSKRAGKEWSEEEEQIYQTTIDQIKQKKEGRQFQEYQYLSPMGEVFGSGKEESNDLIAAINRQKAAGVEKPGIFRRLFGGYWELLSHNAETSMDLLTPISPGAKLVHTRSAIESYERTQVYSSENAFWTKPMQDFILPFLRSTGHALGWKGIPDQLEEKRGIEEYFDVLKYVKNSRLANIAGQVNDLDAWKEFEKNKNQTLFGINPFTRNYESLMRALPKSERNYLDAFESTTDSEERERILQLVPENEKALYIARWKLLSADEIRRAEKDGILSEDQLKEADEQLDQFYKDAENEGFPSTKELFAEYAATRTGGENYADWYRRRYLLPNVPLPGADWVGWHPSVDLDDIKLKVVQTLGEDMHDYDLWESREKTLPYKPYINEEAVEPILHPDDLSKDEMRARIDSIMAANDIDADTFITTMKRPNKENQIEIDVETDRSEEANKTLLQSIT